MSLAQILCLYTKQMVAAEVPVFMYLERALTVLDERTIKQSVEVLKVTAMTKNISFYARIDRYQ